jgi:hypothetical protein
MRAVLLLATALLAGCGTTVDGQPVPPSATERDRALIVEYFDHNNIAARAGAAAQRQFLRRTQHPDVPLECDLGELTVLLEPAMTTLRPDPSWQPGISPASSTASPRGKVFVIGVTATVQREQTTLGTQIGSMHVVVFDGMAYGIAPCPT